MSVRAKCNSNYIFSLRISCKPYFSMFTVLEIQKYKHYPKKWFLFICLAPLLPKCLLLKNSKLQCFLQFFLIIKHSGADPHVLHGNVSTSHYALVSLQIQLAGTAWYFLILPNEAVSWSAVVPSCPGYRCSELEWLAFPNHTWSSCYLENVSTAPPAWIMAHFAECQDCLTTKLATMKLTKVNHLAIP